jgi:hypothetical protein
VFPGLPYYTLRFATVLLAEISVLAVALLFLFQAWAWIAGFIATVVMINLGVSAFLNSISRIEIVKYADPAPRDPARWYPE